MDKILTYLPYNILWLSSTTPTGDAQLNQHQKSNIYIYIIFSGSEQERITLEKASFMVTIYVISSVDQLIPHAHNTIKFHTDDASLSRSGYRSDWPLQREKLFQPTRGTS